MKNQLIRWLAEGSLSDDGRADEIFEMVIDNPSEFDDLVASLDNEDPVVWGHGEDVLEKIAREKALNVLLEDAPFPKGWVKSDIFQAKLDLV